MVYEDNKEREKEIVRFVIEHYDELRKYGNFLSMLHIRALKEVLEEMHLRNLRGLELDVPGIIDLLGLDRIIETAGEDKVIQRIGKDKLIQKIGPEEAFEIVSLYLTRERMEELLDKKKKVD